MSDETKMADALAGELGPQPEPVRFDLGGKTYELPVPCPVRTWLWILQKALAESNADADGVVDAVVDFVTIEVDAILCQLTRLDAGKLAELGPDELRRVRDALVAQLGGELRDSAPFSARNWQAAVEALGRRMTMLIGAPSVGGGHSSPSSPKSVGEAGAK